MDTLQTSIFPYLLKEYLVILIFFLGVTVLALFSVLVIHKLSTEKRTRKRQEYAEEYRGLIEQYIGGRIPGIEPLRGNLQYEAFADVSINMLSSSAAEKEIQIKNLIKEVSALRHYKDLASSSSWVRRYSAIEVLGSFTMEELKEFFIETSNTDPRPEVCVQAIWALSLIADEEILAFITKRLSSDISYSSKFNEFVYTNVIRSFRKRGEIKKLIKFMSGIKDDASVPLVLERDFIGACGAERLHEATDVIKGLLPGFEDKPLMKIACIRALGAIGTLEAGNTLSGLNDDDWRVRAVSARAAYTGYNEAVISRLRELLYDSAYSVRINTARALAKIGEKGLTVLRGETDSKDRFVRDTIRYVLGEVGRNV